MDKTVKQVLVLYRSIGIADLVYDFACVVVKVCQVGIDCGIYVFCTEVYAVGIFGVQFLKLLTVFREGVLGLVYFADVVYVYSKVSHVGGCKRAGLYVAG